MRRGYFIRCHNVEQFFDAVTGRRETESDERTFFKLVLRDRFFVKMRQT